MGADASSYMGARGDDLTLGGSEDIGININQLDPKYLALGRLRSMQQLPNPFFGNPNVPLSLSTPTTLSRARLLLPHPAVQPDQRPAGDGRD